MDKKLNILILEDNQNDAELEVKELKRKGFIFDWKRVETKKDFIKELKDFLPDLVLADYSLPGFDGLSALQITKERDPNMPFIIVTGSLCEEIAIATMKAGVWDYVMKDNLIRLGPAVMEALKRKQEIEKRKQAEEAQKKSEEQFRLIAENTSDNIGITTFDLKAKYIYVSPSIKTVLDYDPEDLLGKSFFDFIHPEDRKVLFPLLKKYVNSKIKKLLTGKKSTDSKTIEFRFKNKAGNWRFMQSTVNIVGKQLLAVTRDITKHKQAEQALLQSEEQMKTIFQNSFDIILIVDIKNGEILKVNHAVKNILGYEKNSLIGKNFSALFPDSPKKNKDELLKEIRVYGAVFESQLFLRSDGSVCPMDLTATLIPWGNDKEALVTLRDVTERKQAEDALRESEQKYRAVLEQSAENIYIVDTKTRRIIESNKTFQNLLGYSADEMKQLTIYDFIAHSENSIEQNVNKLLKQDRA
ncbi:MAG: PAS domain S-box protein, partial [Candidatus Cloacimonetes bacterium]|nr:PAS domain S-box protein [Candidatus Cloacimonadota bacterium]